MEHYVISSSGLATFARCRKLYQLSYEKLLQTPGTQAMEDGTSFHAYVAAYARERRGDKDVRELEPTPNDEMFEVFVEWARRKGAALFDTFAEIKLIEEPIYLELFRTSTTVYWVRMTLDLLVKRKDGWLEIIDWKSFMKAPSLDIDLDFQARLYIAGVSRFFNHPVENGIRFMHGNVRRVPPGTKNSKGAWSEEECYIDNVLVIDTREADTVWQEAIMKARSIDTARNVNNYWKNKIPKEQLDNVWYRTELKGSSPHTCGSCLHKNLCKAEIQHGYLDEQTISMYATRREPIALPEEYKAK
jgi:hypothetical protein